MGGELKITAKFPEGTVEITQFEVVKKAAAGKDQAVGAKMTRRLAPPAENGPPAAIVVTAEGGGTRQTQRSGVSLERGKPFCRRLAI
jgi:hypothetical protein